MLEGLSHGTALAAMIPFIASTCTTIPVVITAAAAVVAMNKGRVARLVTDGAEAVPAVVEGFAEAALGVAVGDVVLGDDEDVGCWPLVLAPLDPAELAALPLADALGVLDALPLDPELLGAVGAEVGVTPGTYNA